MVACKQLLILALYFENLSDNETRNQERYSSIEKKCFSKIVDKLMRKRIRCTFEKGKLLRQRRLFLTCGPCGQRVQHLGQHLRIGMPAPGRDMERMVSVWEELQGRVRAERLAKRLEFA